MNHSKENQESEPKSTREKSTTHFGYQSVAVEDKVEKVAEVFHSAATKYDAINDLMSMGIHRLWKRFTVEAASLKPGQRILDIAGGTGDLSRQFARCVGPDGEVVLADINDSMLRQGRIRLTDEGLVGNIRYVQANAQCLPFPDNYFDRISIAFGLRNVTNIDQALQSMYRVLKPGGKLLVLEFSKPVTPGLAPIYDVYSFKVLPMLGKLVASDEQSYRYLAESIRMHPDQETLKQKMQRAGFDRCEYNNLTGGIVALHTGYKF